MCVNKLILGDNLEILKTMDSETIDLIYLDPPFFSNRTYEVIWGDEGEKRSFEDRFAGGIHHYIHWLKLRVREMHRVLKPTGSIFLHCDWHANAYIRVYILDPVFGRNNFRNEIVWRYSSGGASKKFYSRNHDIIYFYVKGKNYTFKPDEIKVQRTGEVLRRIQSGTPNATRATTLEKLPEDIFEIQYINAMAKERIGYPTQKPETLLERIIKASSNEGDVVLDPFLGGGTTIDVANRLNRKWIGIDQSVMAIKVTDLRLQKRQDELFSTPYEVIIPTYDFEKLTKGDGKDFEIFIVEKFGAIPNLKGGKDYGIDGHTHYGTPIQVKKWKKPVGRATLDEFLTSIQRDDKYLFERNKKEGQICGFIIGFEFSKDIINEVAKLKNTENTIIALKYIRDIIPYENPPKVTLTSEELEDCKYKFEAWGENKSEIDFYSWDFSHDEEAFKADVIMDKEGVQEKKFWEGEHNVAVNAVDKRGLSGMDKVKIKVKDKKK
jgi:DNA modification methylase